MELYEAILDEALVKEIYAVAADDTLEDPECFRRVEQIVCVLDELGIGGGGRHDF